MNIIAFDTTGEYFSVALQDAASTIHRNKAKTSSSATELLLDNISEILFQNNLNIKDIDYLAVTRGPGSFTGVRIGLAAAIGVKIVNNIKILALSNFQVITHKFLQSKNIPDSGDDYFCSSANKDSNECQSYKDFLVLIDARNGNYFYQLLNSKLESLDEAGIANIDFIKQNIISPKNLVIGSNINIFKEYNICEINIDAQDLLKTALYFIKNNIQSQSVTPLYVRPFDAKIAIAVKS